MTEISIANCNSSETLASEILNFARKYKYQNISLTPEFPEKEAHRWNSHRKLT